MKTPHLLNRNSVRLSEGQEVFQNHRHEYFVTDHRRNRVEREAYMGRHTGNVRVVENLQKALEAFLADHYKAAHADPEWIEEAKDLTPEERKSVAACGCDDCLVAGQLLGRI